MGGVQMTLRVLAAMAAADFRDRARRPAFLLVVLAAAGLGYLAAPPASADYAMVKVGAFRGVYDSGYLGIMLAMVGSLWLSLFGFYAVKNTITRDTASGVGQLLAAAPLGKTAYLLGKFLSNLLVLAAMAGALALTAPAMQLLRGESTAVDLLDLWLPFVLLCLPILAVAAAAAVLFESVRPLRGGVGNIIWFFAFASLFVAGLSLGLDAIVDSFAADLAAQHPGVNTEISIGLTGGRRPEPVHLVRAAGHRRAARPAARLRPAGRAARDAARPLVHQVRPFQAASAHPRQGDLGRARGRASGGPLTIIDITRRRSLRTGRTATYPGRAR